MKHSKWKADEMEITINFKALKIAYIFTETGLTFYCVYKFISAGELPTVIAIIWSAGIAVFFISKLIYTSKMTRINDK